MSSLQRSLKLMLKQIISRLHVLYLQWQKVLLLRSRLSLKMRYKSHMSVLKNTWKIFPKRLKRKSTYPQECSPVALLSWMFSCKSAIYFQSPFSSERLWRAASVTFKQGLFHVAFTFLKTQSGKRLKWMK